MPKIDDYEREILSAFEKGELKSVATKEELAKLKAAARYVNGQLAEQPAGHFKPARRGAAKRRTS